MCALVRQKVIAELTDKCKSQEGKMEQVKGFEAERRKYEVDISRYIFIYISTPELPRLLCRPR